MFNCLTFFEVLGSGPLGIQEVAVRQEGSKAKNAGSKQGSKEGRRPGDVKKKTKKTLHRPRVTALIAERK